MNLLFVITLLSTVNAYRFIVNQREQECVFLEVTQQKKIVADLSVASGGNRDIAFKVYDPNEREIYSLIYEEGKYSNLIYINAQTEGTYQFCLDNTMSMKTPKTVEFKLKDEEVEPATEDEVKSIKTKLSQVYSFLDDATYDQKRLRIRERRNKKTNDGTNLRTTILFFVGCVVIIVMAAFQIWYIKKQFRTGGR